MRFEEKIDWYDISKVTCPSFVPQNLLQPMTPASKPWTLSRELSTWLNLLDLVLRDVPASLVAASLGP
jgi:hypothetical protein